MRRVPGFPAALAVVSGTLLAGPAAGWEDSYCHGEPLGAADTRPYPLASSPVSRLGREGIRAMSSSDPQDADKMATAGLNLVLPWEHILRHHPKKTTPPDSPIILRPEDISEKAVAHLRSWAGECAKNDLIMMYMMYVGDEESVRYLCGDLLGHLKKDGVNKPWPAHQYRHVVDWHGHAAKYAPCPLERRYWMGFIRPQLEMVARLLKETGATGGGALELETYVWPSIYPGYSSQKKTFCYCDHCFSDFVKSLGQEETSAALPAGRRFDWLTQRGLLPKYEKSLQDRMTVLIQEMIGEVRKIKPDFVFGFYPYCPFWFYDALIRGSGTPELPCLVFPGPEYSGGYLADASLITDFFGGCPTPASVTHLRLRKLPAMYAGGLWAGPKGGMSADATATAMDRMLRGPDGYWIYKDVPDQKVLQPFWKRFAAINRWTTDHPGPLAAGDVVRSAIPDAIKWVRQNKPEGIVVSDNQIVARYEGPAAEVPVGGGDFDNARTVNETWTGRGSLPPLDGSVLHSGRSSIRFEPSAASEGPCSPYIDRKVTEAEADTAYELSFWVKTADAGEPMRFWVGRANSSAYPHYMYYANYFLPASHNWMRLRVPFRLDQWPLKGGSPPVLRFWCPPTDGKLWLDDVKLQAVQGRTMTVPLNPPADAAGWGTIDWELSPADARCEADIEDAKDEHTLRKRLYPGDGLAPLSAVVGMGPVLLRLTVYPSPAEPVTLEKVEIRFNSNCR